jgi:aerobic C4-dicarboxylate transport protein
MSRLLKSLYIQVLVAIVAGAMLGHFRPDWGSELKPLGDGFIKLIKVIVAPLIFLTLVNGIGGAGDLRKVGRVGIKALVYFEVVTTAALVLGLIVVNLVKPGAGLHANPATLDASAVQSYTSAAKHLTFSEFALSLIPETFVGAFDKGDILPVLLLAVLVGIALSRMNSRAKPALDLVHTLGEILMGVVSVIMRLAPIAAFGAMAFTVGKYGVKSLSSLAQLMACVYLTSAGFVLFVLGGILRANGFRLLATLRYIKEEIFLVVGTSSSESALPRLLERMERLGCSKSVVGLVLPAGYSFNLDGTCIYLTMAAIFIAQATDTPLTLGQQLFMLGVLLLTSKGAAAVTGGGFVTLAATLASTGTLPVSGLALLLGVDRFMSEIRALTNLIGNAVAVLVISKWEGELTETEELRKLRR